ncbi:MAG: hypothetical protein HY699_23265 [Deltaproteobacteria bacterium]|nr:hypothetical protein [Deltaproteobacteria bacterium]
MITALRIGNFKAFAEPQTVPITPPTLIFGADSAGKSLDLVGWWARGHALFIIPVPPAIDPALAL